MSKEIERKFLVKRDVWCAVPLKNEILQGYLTSVVDGCTVRVRVVGENAWLTIKGKTVNITRSEFEYPIPVSDALQILDELCPSNIIRKIRYTVDVDGYEWVVDEFTDDNEGLLLAEIELTDENVDFARPDWLGEEVSHDKRFTNAYLAAHPFRKWPEQHR